MQILHEYQRAQDDPEALCGAIQQLWNHPEGAERMGREGRKFIEKYHTLDQFVQAVKDIAQDVIQEKRGQTKLARNRSSE